METGKPAPRAGLDIVVVAHTHWDREWYRPFQGFRLRLVHMLDRLLDTMAARPDVAHFLLDGQSILLEDYLALRPERKAALRGLLKSGRLGAGPWYVQPDEFLASGESLIRNLLLGTQTAKQHGGAARDGWLPDTFGHAAQLPQILRNFGIETFVFSRGLGDHLAAPALEFWWEAPNGDRVLALHQAGGYFCAGNLGFPSFWGDTGESAPDPELALAQIRALVEQMAPQAATRTFAVWNGADHMPLQQSLPGLIAMLNEHLEGCRVRQGTIEEYAHAVLEAAPTLPVVRGELRGSRYQAMLYSTLSSRIGLKQANHRVERLLVRQAEPLAAMAWLAAGRYPAPQLREAWRLLLQNQAHDSICGCGIDEIHSEMMGRFAQAEQIGSEVVEEAIQALARKVERDAPDPNSLPLFLFNPLGRERCEVIDVTLRLPECRPGYAVSGPSGSSECAQVLSSWSERYAWLDMSTTAAGIRAQVWFWRECMVQLDGLDLAGHEWEERDEGVTLHLRLVESAMGSKEAAARLAAEAERLPAGTRVRVSATYARVHLAFLGCVPACGYAVYRLRGSDHAGEVRAAVRSGENWLENEHLRAEVSAQGKIDLTDKRTGRTVRGLHRLEDMADAGDLYDFGPIPTPDTGAALESCSCTPGVAQGGLLAELHIGARYRVPEKLAPDGCSRSERGVPLPVSTRLRLRAGCPWLECITEVENRARDHRLRLLFPAGVRGTAVHADGQFAITTRPAIPSASSTWCQPPSGIAPHHTWCGTDDGEYGLAILSEGLPEHEGTPTAGGLVLALTLLRAVGELSRGNLATRPGQAGPCRAVPDAQCPGQHTFRYGMLPYAGDVLSAGIPGLAAAFDAPLIARPVPPGHGRLPSSLSLAAVEGANLEVTALKRSEKGDCLVVRFYNTGQSATRGRVGFGLPVRRVYRATAEERRGDALPDAGDRYAIEVQPAEIVTLLVEPALEKAGKKNGMDLT